MGEYAHLNRVRMSPRFRKKRLTERPVTPSFLSSKYRPLSPQCISNTEVFANNNAVPYYVLMDSASRRC